MSKPEYQHEIHERLKAELRIRGTSLAKIGRELGVTPAAMTLVGKGVSRSARIEGAIALALETTPDALWRRADAEDGMT
nr:helix-turn-helix domain-containing protein [uncultured Celeribacter sp.]